jgi:hypothetical protein
MRTKLIIERGVVRTRAVAAGALLLGIALSPATEFTVTNLRDSGQGSLRWAIDTANSAPGADLVTFAPGLHGTIALASQLSVTDSVGVSGPGANRITLSGGGTTRIFDISGSIDVSISGLTISGCMATDVTKGHVSVALGGGIRNVGARLTLCNIALVNNQAVALAAGTGAGGGAVANVFGATLVATGCTFMDNRVSVQPANGRDADGGAIYNEVGSTLTVASSTFTANQATGGADLGSFAGAIHNAISSQAAISDSSFAGNIARGRDGSSATGGRGGAIANFPYGMLAAQSSAVLKVERCTFTGNVAWGGSGLNGNNGGKAIAGAIITSGEGTSTTVNSSEFTGNLSHGGDGDIGGAGGNAFSGALDAGSATLTVADSVFENNEAVGGLGGKKVGNSGSPGGNAYGGAISATTTAFTPKVLPTLDVQRCTFTANRATAGAGRADGPNTGGQGIGGAINAEYGTLTVNLSQFVSNQALGGESGRGSPGPSAGGGISLGSPFNPRTVGSITGCTFENNLVQGGSGGAGASGGNAIGGALFNGIGTMISSQNSFTENRATGGSGGAGGNGGSGQGGGLWNMGSATLANTAITLNVAAGGSLGAGGLAGAASGGGVFNIGSILIDNPGLITGNVPDDCFGCP